MLSPLFGDVMETNSVATVIISIALMLFSGFSMTRLTKRLRLPNVTAYIVVGILIGPFCLNLVPATVIDGMDFLSDIALAFIAFSTGEFFKLSTLKKNGMKVVIITVLEACLATVVVFIDLLYFGCGPGILDSAGSIGFCNCSGIHSDDDSPNRCPRRFCGYTPAGSSAG